MSPQPLMISEVDRRGVPRYGALRSTAVLRLVTVALIAITSEIVPLAFGAHRDHPYLEITIALAGLYALGLCRWAFQSPSSIPRTVVLALIDIAFLCALTLESGGPTSQAKKAFFVIPVVAALVRRSRVTAAWTIAAMIVFVALTIGNRSAEGPAGAVGVFAQAGFIGLTGLAATMLSAVLAQERDHILALARNRRQLLAWTLSAEDRAREALSYKLHDGAVQNLLAGRRLIARARKGDERSLDQVDQLLRDTVIDLRRVIAHLSPHALGQAGLLPAIRLTLTQASEEGGLHVHADLDEQAAGVQDELLYACARELITNVVKHADATHLSVVLQRDDAGVILSVTDDGIGLSAMPPTRPGHLGLSAMQERISFADGRLTIPYRAEPGTCVTLFLPAPQPTAASPRSPLPAPTLTKQA